ncbi:MAG: DPP IV N-terminal domain-containing protein [Planctomycetes bacterium]|nr:DPP IV N-terminal domain-containing protein [Planctomycetota bacterium]
MSPNIAARGYVMRLNAFTQVVTVAIAVSLGLLFGCETTGGKAQPASVPRVAEKPPEPLPPAGPPLGARAGLTFFGDRPEIEEVPFENRLLSNLTRHTFTTEGLDFDPNVDADGKMLVFASTRNSEHPDIYLKSVDGTAVVQLTNDPADDIQPKFSPDGQQVVFCSNRAGNWDIWLINTDGTGRTQLTRSAAEEISPCWSPNTREIAYAAWSQRAQRWEIWTISVDEPGGRRFLAYGMFPAWSPAGTHIAFQRARQRGSRWFSIWTIELVDGEARHPTEIAHSDTAACIAPAWSPDGKALVYCAVRREHDLSRAETDRSIHADLWAVDLETGMHTKLTDGAAPAFNPTLGPSGRVFFVSGHAGMENIWSLAAEADLRVTGARQTAPRVSRATEGETGLRNDQ